MQTVGQRKFNKERVQEPVDKDTLRQSQESSRTPLRALTDVVFNTFKPIHSFNDFYLIKINQNTIFLFNIKIFFDKMLVKKVGILLFYKLRFYKLIKALT